MHRVSAHAQRQRTWIQEHVSMPNHDSLKFPLEQFRAAFCCFEGSVHQDQHEFVSAIAARNIACANNFSDQIAERPQQRIACRMSVCIVECLEGVEITNDESQILFITAGAVDLSGQSLIQVAAIE